MAARSAGKPARERLLEAMTLVAARYGYGGATVARVVDQAGMSRATFYEHFEGREDCFRAAFRRAAAPVRADLDAALHGGERPAPWRIVARSLRAAEDHPAAARLLFIEGFAGDAAVRAEMEELLELVERAIDSYLEAAEPQEPIEMPARALLGGLGNLVATRLFRRGGGLLEAVGDLQRWVASYRLEAGRARLGAGRWEELGRSWAEVAPLHPQPSPAPAPLPRGRSALPAAQLASEHRERIVNATAKCSAESGYLAMTVADVVSAAGVTRAAFYEQFRDKEDAFLATLTYGIEHAAAAAAGRFFTEDSWPERVWNGLDAFADYISSSPDLAVASTVEFFSAGPAAIGRSFDGRMAFTLFLEDGYRQRPEAERLPRICSETIAGAVEELMRHQVVSGRAERIRELVPLMAYMAVTPFIGTGAALALVSEKCRETV